VVLKGTRHLARKSIPQSVSRAKDGLPANGNQPSLQPLAVHPPKAPPRENAVPHTLLLLLH